MVFRLSARTKLLSYSAAVLLVGGLTPLAAAPSQAAAPVYSSITIVDSAGVPFAGEQVSLHGDDVHAAGVLDATGSISFAGQLPDEPAEAHLHVWSAAVGSYFTYVWDGEALIEGDIWDDLAPLLFGAGGIQFEAALPGLAPPVDIAGTVRDSSGVAMGSCSVSMINAEGQYGRYGTCAADGSYAIRGVAPGSYNLAFDRYDASGDGPYGYSTGWYKDSRNEAGATPVVVVSGQTQTANHTLLRKGQIIGSINELVAGAVVPVIAPNTAVVAYPRGSSVADPSAVLGRSVNGKYAIDVAPGSYTVAFGSHTSGASLASFVPRQYYDLSATEASSTPVEVREASNISPINALYAAAVERLAGVDRFGTSAAISAASFPVGVPVAYVANGMNFPDALSGAAAAGAAKGPVLLVSAGSIPAAVQAELRRLKPAQIVVLGGAAVVQESVATSLKSYTSGAVTRLAGTDRFATSAAISKASFSVGSDVAYIANGMNFPDALSGAAVAGNKGGPVLLVSSTSIPAAVKTELNRLKPKKIVVLGGVGVVSASVLTTLKGYTSGSVTRLAGPDRFSTSAAISQTSFPARMPVVFVANGMNFPDALSGAAIAGVKGGPVLLVSATTIPAAVQAELVRLKPAQIVVLGGDGVISPAVQALLASYAGK